MNSEATKPRLRVQSFHNIDTLLQLIPMTLPVKHKIIIIVQFLLQINTFADFLLKNRTASKLSETQIQS